MEVYEQLIRNEGKCDTANAMKTIRDYLVMSIVRSKVIEIQKQEEQVRTLEKSIMEFVLLKGSILPDQLAPLLQEDATTLVDVVHHFVSNNFLIYQADGKVAFYSRLV